MSRFLTSDWISFSAWAEIHDVFGDGHEYDWALVGDDQLEPEEEVPKVDKNLQDVCLFYK